MAVASVNAQKGTQERCVKSVSPLTTKMEMTAKVWYQ